MSKIHIPTATASGCYNCQPSDIFSSKGWNSGSHPNAFIEIDLGEIKKIKKIKLTVDQVPEGLTEHFIKGGENPNPTIIYGHSSGFTNSGDELVFHLPKPEIRYLRIETTVSPSWVAWKNLEIYEKRK